MPAIGNKNFFAFANESLREIAKNIPLTIEKIIGIRIIGVIIDAAKTEWNHLRFLIQVELIVAQIGEMTIDIQQMTLFDELARLNILIGKHPKTMDG